ncbi:MAG: hypothetical protein WAV02_03800 [Stellaceae bacterium]
MARATTALGAQGKERLALHRVDQLYSTIRAALRYSTLAFGFWCLYLAIDSIAGKTTAFTMALSILWDVRLVFAFSVAGLSTIWAIAERKLRQRKVAYMQGRIKDLETKIDPQRSSSGLTEKGRTNPRDRL